MLSGNGNPSGDTCGHVGFVAAVLSVVRGSSDRQKPWPGAMQLPLSQ